jgi:GT2 family glycosyltransferase
MKIAIVFPVFNGLNYTKTCLRSLFEQIGTNDSLEVMFEVVVVDDGSTDGTSQWITDHFPNVHLLNGNGNLWWSGGINKAIEYGLNHIHTDYFIWWNNDILPATNYFDAVKTLLKTHPTDTIIGSKIFLAQLPDVVWSMGGLFDPKTGQKSMVGSNQKDSHSLNNQIPCDWLTGMGTITHNTVYRNIGLLDERNFPQYHGDSDFTFRAKKAGYRIVADPTLIIYNDTRNSGLKHDEKFSQLWQSLFSIRSNFNLKKDFLFYRKHASSLRAFLVPVTKYLRYIGGFLKWKILGLFGIQRTGRQ